MERTVAVPRPSGKTGASVRAVEGAAARDPGSTVFFRVNGGALGSGITWSLKTKANTNDVYGAWHARRNEVHFSFHESGQTHYAVDRRQRSRLPVGTPSHAAVRPVAFEAGPGVWFAKRIAVPRSELSPGWTEPAPADVVEIPLDSLRDGVGLDFYILEESCGTIEFQDAFPVALLRRGVSGHALVVATPLSLDGPVGETLAGPIEEYRSLLVERGVSLPCRDVLIAEDPEIPELQRDVEILFRL